MTINYECNFNLKDYIDENGVGVSDEELTATKAAIEKAGYDWYQEGDEISIEGEIDVDDYSTDAEDVKAEITCILWKVGQIDADVYTKATKCDPDWDSIYGF